MAVSSYIFSYADVRAVLGVEDDELKDSRIELKVFEISLLNSLKEISADLVEDFTTTSALPTPDEDQTEFLNTVKWFSTYHLAHDMLGSLSLFAPRTVSDGKAMVQRQSDPFEAVRESVKNALGRTRAQLAAYYAEEDPVDYTIGLLGVVVSIPDSDPVLGE